MAMTSVNIDKELLARVKAQFGVRTNREAIELALQEVDLRRRQLEAIDRLAELIDPYAEPHPSDVASGAHHKGLSRKDEVA